MNVIAHSVDPLNFHLTDWFPDSPYPDPAWPGCRAWLAGHERRAQPAWWWCGEVQVPILLSEDERLGWDTEAYAWGKFLFAHCCVWCVDVGIWNYVLCDGELLTYIVYMFILLIILILDLVDMEYIIRNYKSRNSIIRWLHNQWSHLILLTGV